MGKYQIKKAGIGMKKPTSKLDGRVFESTTFGLCYIIFSKPFKEGCLGYPVLIVSVMPWGMIHPFLTYVSDDTETWAGEITTDRGEKVSSVKTEIYI